MQELGGEKAEDFDGAGKAIGGRVRDAGGRSGGGEG